MGIDMEIDLAIFHANPRHGGMERYTFDLATELLRRGHSVTTAAVRFSDDWPGKRSVITTIGYGGFSTPLDRELYEGKLLHAMQPVDHATIYQPHSGILHEVFDNKPLLRRLAVRFNAKRRHLLELERQHAETSHFLLLSERQRRAAQRYLDVPDDRITVIEHGIDTRRFAPRPRGDHPPTAVFVGQDFRRKRLGFALRIIAGTDLRLTVVGRDDPAPFRRLAAQLGIADRVEFVGPLADVRPVYAGADVLLHPAIEEPFGLVVLEAAAMGVPCVVSADIGAADSVQRHALGRVVPDANNIDAWRSALGEVTDNPDPWRERCIAARPTLDFENHVDRVVALYTQLA